MLGNKEKDKIVKRYGNYYWEQIKKLSESYYKDLEERVREIEEKDQRIVELEQKVQELQEVDNKRAFRLYAVLYDVLEKQDSENVASRIDYLTGKDYSEMCEMYKTAKNLKQHDRELVKEVCGKIARNVRVRKIQEEWYAIETDLRAALDQIEKEFEK